MPVFTVTGLLLYRARRRNKRALAAVTPSGQMEDGTSVLVVHASQTGIAERLARLSAAAFPQATVLAMAAVSPADLRAAGTALFVVADYGEGDAPDPAHAFERSVMAMPADLSGVDYALIALGDREYAGFCAFGHRVDAWLHAGGARRLFDLIELDGGDADDERHWQQQLHAIGADTQQPLAAGGLCAVAAGRADAGQSGQSGCTGLPHRAGRASGCRLGTGAIADLANTYSIPGYTRVDLTADYRIADRYSLGLVVPNVENTFYIEQPVGRTTNYPGSPRTVSIRLRAEIYVEKPSGFPLCVTAAPRTPRLTFP